MDFYLDGLLNFPDITVRSCQQKEDYILLKLDFLNEGIRCPHYQNYTDNIHQNLLLKNSEELNQQEQTDWLPFIR